MPRTVSTQSYNMADIIREAVAIDNLYPAYRAWLFTLVQQGGSFARDQRADIFTESFWNKRVECMACHNTAWSASVGRTFISPFGRSQNDALARPRHENFVFPKTASDIGHPFTPSEWQTPFGDLPEGLTRAYPFEGWHDACGKVTIDATPSDLSASAAGLVRGLGTSPTIWKVDASLYDGVAAMGMGASLDSGPNVAAAWLHHAFANDVWREVMGHSLTIGNYVSRNAAQYDKAGEVTSVTHISGPRGGISLRNVLRNILSSREFNESLNASVPKLYEPFFDDPTNNGNPGGLRDRDWAADRIHRHSADVLFRSARYALGQSPPLHFPSNSAFPQPDDAVAQGMSIGPESREHTTPSLEQMLDWETIASRDLCGTRDAHDDWIHALINYADAHPVLSTRNVVDALKFRLLSVATESDDERALIATLLGGRDLDAAFATRPVAGTLDPIASGLRSLCAALLASPEFMMSGGRRPGPSELVVRVGNLGKTSQELVEESVIEACLSWHLYFGPFVSANACDPAARAAARKAVNADWQRLLQVCPRGGSFFFEAEVIRPLCQDCPVVQLSLERLPRGVDPRQPTGFGGESLPPFREHGGVFLAYAPNAKIVGLSQTLTIRRADGSKSPASAGAVLDEGDAIDIPAGVFIAMEDNEGFTFQTPKEGLPAAPNGDSWTFMATGPKAASEGWELPADKVNPLLADSP